MTVPVHFFLLLAAALFAVGAVGFLLRRNLLVLLMSIELMLNAVNLTLVAFNRVHSLGSSPDGSSLARHDGQILAFFVIAIAAAEAAVGLAIVLAFYRLRRSVRSDQATALKN